MTSGASGGIRDPRCGFRWDHHNERVPDSLLPTSWAQNRATPSYIHVAEAREVELG